MRARSRVRMEGGQRGTCSPTKQKAISAIEPTRVSPSSGGSGARRGFRDGEYSSFRGSRSCSDPSTALAMAISVSLASLTIEGQRGWGAWPATGAPPAARAVLARSLRTIRRIALAQLPCINNAVGCRWVQMRSTRAPSTAPQAEVGCSAGGTVEREQRR